MAHRKNYYFPLVYAPREFQGIFRQPGITFFMELCYFKKAPAILNVVRRESFVIPRLQFRLFTRLKYPFQNIQRIAHRFLHKLVQENRRKFLVK